MALHIVLSTIGTDTKVLHGCDSRESAIDYIKSLATKWACDNVGVNNFVDTLEATELPQRAGFYIQYTDRNTRTEIVASQVIATPVSGWTGTYNTYTTKQLTRWFIVETEANLVLASALDKLSSDVDAMVMEYRELDEVREADISSLSSQLDDANGVISTLEVRIRELEDTIAMNSRTKVHRRHQLFDPVVAAPAPSNAWSSTSSYDEVVNELKNKLAEMPFRKAVASAIPLPPPPPPPSFYNKAPAANLIQWEDAESPNDVVTKSLDELLDELDNNIDRGGFERW